MYPIPLSALHGDNVISRSNRTPWFDRPSLLEYLEALDVDSDAAAKPFRFPVQLVLRPHDAFRGYAGQIVSGTVRPGDSVTVQPSGATARIARVVTWDGDLASAHAPMSVMLTLDTEVDVSRGDVLTHGAAHVGRRFEAEVVWMDERSLDPARVYLLKHGTRTVTAEVNRGLMLNQIGQLTVTAARPLVFDRYRDNRGTGSFILIDPSTHFTSGAGMIVEPAREDVVPATRPSAAQRLAQLARAAASDGDAAEAVGRALEEMLT